MIHYHGADLNPDRIGADFIRGRHIFVSFAYPRQITLAAEFAQSFACDNGAFTTWRQGKEYDCGKYLEWISEWYRHPAFDWCLIPDKIDGTESDNLKLINAWTYGEHIGVPVWHLHESIAHLQWLSKVFPRVALGSSGEYAKVGTFEWWNRIIEAMDAICKDGRPPCKLHGLRMLNPKVFTKLPFASADSTNVAQNMGHTKRWKNYAPVTTEMRAKVLADRIEAYNSASIWKSESIFEK